MDRSQKLNIIYQITESLASKNDNDFISILEEFNFDTSGSSILGKINKKDYISEKLKGGQSNDILELAKHLSIDILKSISIINPEFWKQDSFRLFISHLASNKIMANKIKENLDMWGISCFVAHEDIEPTKEWQNEIELALKTCDGLIALIEPHFHNSNWTDQEVGFALGRDLVIIPVNLGHAPYGFIGKIQAIPELDFKKQLDLIIGILIKNSRSKKKMAFALMSNFEKANSFYNATRFAKLLAVNTFWNDDLIKRLQKAPNNNSQIKLAYEVEDIVVKILDEYNRGH